MNLKQRIRRDAKRLAGDDAASALHACLVEHLFDPDFSATFLARKSGATREVHDRLVVVVGPLRRYVTELRMLEAARRVRETELPFPEIGKRLGYRVPRTFRRAFKDHHRTLPSEMRERARAEAATVETAKAESARAPDAQAAAESALEQLDDEDGRLMPPANAARLRRRLALGLLDDEEATELRARLHRLHPELDEPAPADEPEASPPLVLSSTRPDFEILAAAGVFGPILDHPEADLRHALLEGVRMTTMTALLVLKELCCDLCLKDPERVLAAAELGVYLVERHRQWLVDGPVNWPALAWLAVGRVKLLTHDFAGADRALAFAWEEVPQGGTLTPWIETEARRVEGFMHLGQGRYDPAEAALDRALELAESSWRRAGGYFGADHKATEPPGPAHADTAVFTGLLIHEMARLLGRGQGFDGYDLLLREAVERFRFIGAPLLQVAAEAELTVVSALRGQAGDARRLAADAADFLDRLPSHRRAWAAARRLRALENGGAEAPPEILSEQLQALCGELDSLRWEITGRQAAPAAAARAAKTREARA